MERSISIGRINKHETRDISMGEITVIDRAKQILATDKTEGKLLELAGKYRDVIACNNSIDHQMIKRGHLTLIKARTGIQKTGKAARDDMTKLAKAIIAEEKRLIGITEPEEKRLQSLREEWEAAEKRREEEDARIEQERVAKLRAAIDAILSHKMASPNEDLPHLNRRMAELKQLIITPDTFAEFCDEALRARDEMLEVLEERYLDREIYEEEQAELAKQKAEQAAEAARLQAEREEIERQKREIAERERQAAAEAVKNHAARSMRSVVNDAEAAAEPASAPQPAEASEAPVPQQIVAPEPDTQPDRTDVEVAAEAFVEAVEEPDTDQSSPEAVFLKRKQELEEKMLEDLIFEVRRFVANNAGAAPHSITVTVRDRVPVKVTTLF